MKNHLTFSSRPHWCNNLVGFLLTIYITFGCLAFLIGPDVYAQVVCSVTGFTVGLCSLLVQRTRLSWKIMVAALCIAAWMVICSLMGSGPMRIRFLFVIAQAGLLSCLLEKRIATFWVWIPYICFTLYYALKLYELGDANLVSELLSRNAISAVLLWASSLVILVREAKGQHWNSLIALPVAVLSFVAVGRSGILASSVLMALLIASEARQVWNWKSGFPRKFWFGFVGALILTAVIAGARLQNTETAFRFSNEGVESQVRSQIVAEYIEHLDWGGFLIGLPPSASPTMEMLDDDPHNSVINAHMFLGVLVVPLIAIIVAAALCAIARPTISGAVLVALVLRSATDNIFFVNFFDFIIVYCIFTVFRNMHLGSLAVHVGPPGKPPGSTLGRKSKQRRPLDLGPDPRVDP
jgi:hypothetical protein